MICANKGKIYKKLIKRKPLGLFYILFFISKSSLNTMSFMATVVIYLKKKVTFNKFMWNYSVYIVLLLRCYYDVLNFIRTFYHFLT